MSKVVSKGLWAIAATAALGVLGAPGLAQAAPSGAVDAGVPLSSVVYGTGCVYTLRVPVNSSGTVTFWEKRQGSPKHLIGSDVPDGAAATLEWWPRTIGDRLVYAKQNGVVGPSTVIRVRQGYGSGGMCFAV